MRNIIDQSRILITGGAGFIGSHVVEELLQQNPASIIILDNLTRGSYYNMQKFSGDMRVSFVEGDIRNTDLLEDLISKSEYVFHLAALRINACAADPTEGFEVMTYAIFNLAKLCVKHKIKKVVYSSSASIYGLAQHYPTPESDHPYDNQTFYGAAKLWGEQLFRSYKFMFGLDYVALRYFNVYGPRMDTDGKYTEVIVRWLDCISDGKPPVIYGDGTTTMDLVYVTDVAKANVAALTSVISDQVINIGNGEEVSLRQLLNMLLKVNKSNLVPINAKENKINPVSRRLADNTKAKKILKYVPSYPLERGLTEMCNWYFEKRKLKVALL